MPTWDELDRLTKPRQILVVLAAWIASLVLRGVLDATDPDTLGWTTYFLQLALMGVLVAMCIGRTLVLFHRGVEDRNPEVGGSVEQRRAGPLVTERSVIIALIAAVVILRVIRGRGTGDLDAVALGVQLGATGLLVAIGFRRVFLMVRGRSEFSMWPWVWLCLFISTAVAATGQGDSTAYDVAFGLVLALAVALLVMAVYGAVKHRQHRRG